MSVVTKHMKDWAPAAMSICAVLLTAAYAATKESRAADGIRDAGALASSLIDAASIAERTARTTKQIEELTQRRGDLERRMEDSRKPSCVVAELTETARKTGVVVREIQPFGAAGHSAGLQDHHKVYPQYRIQVYGTYIQVAEYMAKCGAQRIPARVRDFRIGRVIGQEQAEGGRLAAELIVEAFQPLEPEKPEAQSK